MILPMKTEPDPGVGLFAVKMLHTVVWVFFVSCILGVPVSAALHQFRWCAIFAGLVLLECLVLAANRCRCPLTDLATRFAPEDSPNFDIFLPVWLARYNKQIFGTIFLLGSLFAIAEWFLASR